MGQFIYAPANPIWMNEVVTQNEAYNTLPFAYTTGNIPYAQKVKFAIPTRLQILSDWLPTLKIYKCDTGVLIDTLAPSTPTSGVLEQTFTCYEFTITWNAYPADTYYIEITYTNDDPLLVTWRSGAIQSAQNWPGTLVYEYCNSQNQFSVIWKTGIVMAIVVEGAIAEYEPGFEDVIYEDQYYNVTKLNSIPYRSFTLYAGSATGFAGIPPYIGDKLNWVFACDQIKIDGVYYQNLDGAKWETARTPPNGTLFIGLKIKIIEVNNLFLQTYDAGQIPDGAVKVVDRVLDYKNNSANITISGIFTAASLLTKIVIYNYGGDIFTLNASTAADGSAPIAPPFTTTGQLKEVWEINEPFNAVSTLYLLGLAGTNCDIYVRYDQLDAPYILPPTPTSAHIKGEVGMYEEVTVGDFSNDWNIGTGEGLGRYAGCVISGTNGTKDRNGLLAIGWDPSQPLTRDMLVGNTNNTVTIAKGNLPAEGVNMFADQANDTPDDYPTATSTVAMVSDPSFQSRKAYTMHKGNLPATRGVTANLGSGNPLDVSNAARVTLFYVCITD